VPRVREALTLHAAADLHAMIDLSDGLASDVRHIADESDVGVILEADRIPIHDDVDPSLPQAERLRRALCDGEDFELFFAVSPADAAKLLSRNDLGLPLTQIGECIDGNDCFMRASGGELRPLPRGGWEHALD
jgi:thiamine-monophosphate kinase